MEIFVRARRFVAKSEARFCPRQKGISIAASQPAGRGGIAGHPHRHHCSAGGAPLRRENRKLRRRDRWRFIHHVFLDVMAGHGTRHRQHGRGRGTSARRHGRAIVPAGFAPASIRHQGVFNIVSRHLSRRNHAGVAGKDRCQSGRRSIGLCTIGSPLYGDGHHRLHGLAHAGEFLRLVARQKFSTGSGIWRRHVFRAA